MKFVEQEEKKHRLKILLTIKSNFAPSVNRPNSLEKKIDPIYAHGKNNFYL